MSQKTMTPEEWEELVRNFCKEITRSVTRKRGDVGRIAKLLGLKQQSISDMRSGRITGSVVVNIRLFFLKAGIPDNEARKFLEHPQVMIQNLETPSALDKLVFELKNLYSENELAAWFRLLISKRVVEKDLGIEVKARMKKSAKS
ncbi:MAG: hypothetical protein AB7G93_00815 [Bdellovibrionales bacterium]